MDDRGQATGRSLTAAPQGGATGRAPGETEPERWLFEGFVLDLSAHVLRDPAGRDVPLRRSEFALLTTFLRAPGRALSRDYLLDAVAGRRAEAFDRSIDVLVGRLRKHIEPDPKAPRLIVTVPGVRYKFVARPRSAPATEEGDAAPITAPPPPARPAERRQLTIMRCGIAGAGSTAASLDPEDWGEVVAAFRACCAEIIARFGGFVAPSVDHSVVAWFGYPEANEVDAERAIHAALALVAAVPAIRRGAGSPVYAHLGVASGLVLVSEAEQGTRGLAALGEAPSLAGALLSLAAADTVLIAARTRELVGRLFALRALGPLSAAGFANPIEAWVVIGPGSAEGRFAALRARKLSPLVGRDEELALLLRRWEQAKAGSGRVVLISAEPGLGKSRLAETLVERIAAERHVRLRYFCSPHHQDSAFYPIIAQMERAAGFARDDSPEAKISKLRELLVDFTPVEGVVLIADLHGLPSAGIAPPFDLTPQKKREKTFEALVGQGERLARRQPVLMLFEDVHWMDPSSRELLDRIIQRIGDWPLLLIATFRPEFSPPWTGQPGVTALTLSRLDREATSAMVANIAGASTLSPDIVQEIAERADGVPLFVEELTQAVAETGAKLAAAVSAIPRSPASVPTTLQASLNARLDRLGPAARDVAQKGAVIGREFSYQLLAAIADLPDPALREALDKLTSSGLLFVRGDPPNSIYTFKHALVQDAAYGALLRSRCQDLHARIASILETRFAELVAGRPELLALHLEQAGDLPRATLQWITAGDLSEQRGAGLEAVAQYRKAEHLATSVPAGAVRLREPEIGIKLGNALIQVEGYNSESGRQAFQRARSAAAELGLHEDFARAGIGIAPLLFGQCRYSAAIEILQDLSSKFLNRLRPQTWIHLWTMLGVATYCIGDLKAALDYEMRALELDNEIECTHEHPIGGGDPAIVCRSYAAIIDSAMGSLDRSRIRSEEAWTIAKARGHAFSVAWAGLVRLRSLLPLGRYAECAPILDECFEICDRYGFNARMGVLRVYRGAAWFGLGEKERGLTDMRSGLAIWRQTSGTFHLTHWISEFVRCLLHDGKIGEADRTLQKAEEIIENTEERSAFPEIRRLRGRWYEMTGNIRSADHHYREALEWSCEREAKLFELRAAINLARLWRDQGRREDARNLLVPVYAWFTEGFDAPDLVEAKAVLDELDGQ